MIESTSEKEGYFHRLSLAAGSTSHCDWIDSERASTCSETTENSDFPHPTRLYQCALVLSGFLATFQTIGANQTYGVFQEYYTSTGDSIIKGPGEYALASLIGTIASSLTWSGSIFVSLIISKGCDLSLMCFAGSVLMSLGFVLASVTTKLSYLFLTQGILVGLGSSMLYYPVISLTPVYFNRHRGFAMGIAMAGSGAGGLVLAPVTQTLLAHFGGPVTLRILGVWNFVVCVPISFVIRPHPAFQPVRPSLELAKRGTFILQLLASFLQAAGNIIPLYYLTVYSVDVLGLSPTNGSMLLAVSNAVNSVARVSTGLLADYVGRQNTIIVCVLLSGIFPFALWFNASRGRFLAFIVLNGIASGGYSALLPTTIAEIYGREHYSSANAAIYFVRGLGAILGAPVAGVLLGYQAAPGQKKALPDDLKRKFDKISGYDGALLLIAGISILFVRWFDARAKGKWRWIA